MTSSITSTPTKPVHWTEFHAGRLAEMIRVAQAAGQHTLKYFQSDELIVDLKRDQSPVTIADREAEQLVRDAIAQRYPTDTIVGEEGEDRDGGSDYRWVVDPIDGTKSFICGVPLYSTLVALEYQSQPLGGVICLPALNQMVVAATGLGAWWQPRSGDWQRARVSQRSSLDEAIFVVSQVDSFEKRGAGYIYDEIERRAFVTRSWGDGYGYAMVATGRADLMIDPECNAWDVAPMLPILAEAGGRFSDWKGNSTARGGDGVGANAAIYDEVMSLMEQERRIELNE